jgi:hypothetical protein
LALLIAARPAHPDDEEVSAVRCDHELLRDGPQVRVVLPDVLPPDWDSIKREIEREIDDGAERVMVMRRDARSHAYDSGVERLVLGLEAEGIPTIIVWQDEPTALI